MTQRMATKTNLLFNIAPVRAGLAQANNLINDSPLRIQLRATRRNSTVMQDSRYGRAMHGIFHGELINR